MFRRLAVVAAVGTALATIAAPASASTAAAAATSVRVQAAGASEGHALAPAGTTIGWGISAYKCGDGVIGAQSKQAKNGPGVNGLVSTHQLQRWNGSGWSTLASRSFGKASPANGVWYYAPGAGLRLDWKPATRGDYRINVVFKFYNGNTKVAQKKLNTLQTQGTVCRFS